MTKRKCVEIQNDRRLIHAFGLFFVRVLAEVGCHRDCVYSDVERTMRIAGTDVKNRLRGNNPRTAYDECFFLTISAKKACTEFSSLVGLFIRTRVCIRILFFS